MQTQKTTSFAVENELLLIQLSKAAKEIVEELGSGCGSGRGGSRCRTRFGGSCRGRAADGQTRATIINDL